MLRCKGSSMRHRLQSLVTLLALASNLCAGAPAVSTPGDGENERSAIYDEVISELISRLDRDRNSAGDAAYKLARLGKRAVPALSELLEKHYGKEKGNAQVAQYCIWALAQINSADAVK